MEKNTISMAPKSLIRRPSGHVRASIASGGFRGSQTKGSPKLVGFWGSSVMEDVHSHGGNGLYKPMVITGWWLVMVNDG